MAIVVDMANRLAQVTKAQLPQHLTAKFTQKTPGMGDSTIASDSESESLFSFVTTTMASIAQNAAAAPPLNAWDKPTVCTKSALRQRTNLHTLWTTRREPPHKPLPRTPL